jgi:hypothetical protein
VSHILRPSSALNTEIAGVMAPSLWSKAAPSTPIAITNTRSPCLMPRSDISARIPPSPSLSARVTTATYLSEVVIKNVQMISESMPIATVGVAERLVACRNPALAKQRARKREELLQATERRLTRIADEVRRKPAKHDAGVIGLAVGAVIDKHKMKKHFALDIADGRFTFHRRQEEIAAPIEPGRR